MAIRTAPAEHEDHVLLNTDWSGYLKILNALGPSRGVRVTYDRGRLEIMSISFEHAHLERLLGDFFRAYMEETDIDYCNGGDQTFKRKDLDRGMEPDNCYWIAHAQQMVGVKRWNPRWHPPPDLAIEVTITHGLINRLPIYAALGIPEVWWYHNEKIEILRLNHKGQYERRPVSPTFPQLPPEVAAQHLGMADQIVDSQIVKRLRQWLREHLPQITS